MELATAPRILIWGLLLLACVSKCAEGRGLAGVGADLLGAKDVSVISGPTLLGVCQSEVDETNTYLADALALLTKMSLNKNDIASGWEFGLLSEALARLPGPGTGSTNATLMEAALQLASKPFFVELAKLDVHDNDVRSLAWSPNGQHLASASYDGTVLVFQAENGTLNGSKAPQVLPHLDNNVYSVAWSPDGMNLATGAEDDIVRVYTVLADGAVDPIPQILNGTHEGNVYAVAFSPDGTQLASGSSDDTIIIWSIASNGTVDESPQILTGHENSIYALAWSPDGSLLASGSYDDNIVLWPRAADGTFPTSADVESTGFGDWGLTARSLPNSSQSDGGPQPQVLNSHQGNVNALAWSPDGTYLASGSSDDTIHIWAMNGSLASEDAQIIFTDDRAIVSLAWSPDGQSLAAGGSDDKVYIWEVEEDGYVGQNGPFIIEQYGNVYAVVWAPSTFPSITVGGSDESIRQLAVGMKSALSSVFPSESEYEENANVVAWSPDGTTLAVASEDIIYLHPAAADGTVDWANPKVFASDVDEVNTLAWSPDGKHIAYGGDIELFTNLRVRAVLPGRELDAANAVMLPGHATEITSVAWSPDGQILATASEDNTILVWPVVDGTINASSVEILSGHKGEVLCLAWAPDGSVLASGSDDEAVFVWKVADGTGTTLFQPVAAQTLLGHTSHVQAVAWSPDGKWFASASKDNTVRVWRAENGVIGTKPTAVLEHDDDVQALAWKPDSAVLATGGETNHILLWAIGSEGPLPRDTVQSLEAHTGDVESLSWHPMSAVLASASYDNTAKVWSVVSVDDMRLALSGLLWPNMTISASEASSYGVPTSLFTFAKAPLPVK